MYIYKRQVHTKLYGTNKKVRNEKAKLYQLPKQKTVRSRMWNSLHQCGIKWPMET